MFKKLVLYFFLNVSSSLSRVLLFYPLAQASQGEAILSICSVCGNLMLLSAAGKIKALIYFLMASV